VSGASGVLVNVAKTLKIAIAGAGGVSTSAIEGDAGHQRRRAL
jgi:hypothetical protein